ncbi:penicillin-binding protein 2 [Microbacterium sp. NPDC019599]|uniref:peptidoglycan D,D-transpeptidase FtsI family protein n=1 Tax=Microbacterium sp. NPDC019599 TaxID=3154690 RepID=UPI0033C278B9
MTTRSTRSPRRRTVVALAVVLAILAGFIVRLVDIQVVSAREHIEDSLATALGSSRPLYGTRGSIIDETGQTLAGSILLYDAQLDPSNVRDITRENDDGEKEEVTWAQMAAEIGEITGQTAEEIQAVVDDALASDPDSQYAQLKRGLSTEQYRDLAALGIPFLYFDPHPSRMYPDGAVAGNLVGYMGSDGAALGGLEQRENDCLTATDGKMTYEKGKDGVVIPGTEVETPAVDGGTLQLTINRDLQWYLQQLIAEQVQDMGALSGTITVVEAKTGKIRAAADYPTVDPNDVGASDPDDRGSRIFLNSFEPGSTFKPLTAATLIDAGGQTPTSTVNASSRESFPNGARVGDAFQHPAYEYTLAGVLIDSSNVGISKFAERVSAQTRYDYLKKFGIGDGSEIDFYGQPTGYLPTPENWDNQSYYNIAFGQGVSTTIPELVGAYQAIANDGLKVPLSLIQSCTNSDGTVVEPEQGATSQVVKESTAVAVQQMMENVALQSTLAPQIAVPGYNVADKTGTGEKTDGNGHYKSGVYFTTMIGFAPAEDPQYVVAVTLDEPTRIKSSGANASAWQKAMTQVLKTYRVMPSTVEPTLLPKFG